MQWLTHLNAESLAPQDSMRVEVSGGRITSTMERRELLIYKLSQSKGRGSSCRNNDFKDGCVKWKERFETPVRITYRQQGAQRNATAPNYTHLHGESYLFEDGAGVPGAKASEKVFMMDGTRGYHVYSAINDRIIGPAGEPIFWQKRLGGYSTTSHFGPPQYAHSGSQRDVTWVEGDEHYDGRASEIFKGLNIKVNGYGLRSAPPPDEQWLPPPSSFQIDEACANGLQYRT